MLDRSHETEAERGATRARPPEPAPPLQFGTLGWASAMGNSAVARIARQSVDAPPELALEEDAGAMLEPEDGAEPGLAIEELPEELPE